MIEKPFSPRIQGVPDPVFSKDSSRPGLSLDSSHPMILSKLWIIRDPFQLVISNVPARLRPPLISGPFNPT
ncbi:hypothetical protein F2Q69_00058771 [Brassica cretica]|uniref:Uncharacterized protein n=1 Tax=Brassica cretica TaxID=69181 RepID=A0A8S9REN9_BRACR|nr:hypothetical protein F2Q69_00058771 [Brassica cretica]